MKVLIVEDEGITKLMLTRYMENFFTEVFSAQNGAEGLSLFKLHNPDVVVTDLAMPVMNGFDLIKNIKEISPATPIIVTTAYRNEANALDGVTVLYKPLSRKRLEEAIQNITNP